MARIAKRQRTLTVAALGHAEDNKLAAVALTARRLVPKAASLHPRRQLTNREIILANTFQLASEPATMKATSHCENDFGRMVQIWSTFARSRIFQRLTIEAQAS